MNFYVYLVFMNKFSYFEKNITFWLKEKYNNNKY